MKKINRLVLVSLIAINSLLIQSKVKAESIEILAHPSKKGAFITSPFQAGYSALENHVKSYGTKLNEMDELAVFPNNGTKGSITIPVLFANWADYDPSLICENYNQTSVETLSDFLNHNENGPARYFARISGDQLKINFEVIPMISSESSSYLLTRSSYITVNNKGNEAAKKTELVKDLIKSAIVDKQTNFKNYDADNNKILDGLLVVYEGPRSTLAGLGLDILLSEADQYINVAETADKKDTNKETIKQQNILLSRIITAPEYNSCKDPNDPNSSTSTVGFNASINDDVAKLLIGLSNYKDLGYYALADRAGDANKPFHMSAMEKSLFGGWIKAAEIKSSGRFHVKGHHLRANEVYDDNVNYIYKIPVNGSEDHFLTIEYADFNADELANTTKARSRVEAGLVVFEVDKTKTGSEQIKRLVPVNKVLKDASGALQANDTLAYELDNFKINISNLEINAGNATFTILFGDDKLYDLGYKYYGYGTVNHDKEAQRGSVIYRDLSVNNYEGYGETLYNVIVSVPLPKYTKFETQDSVTATHCSQESAHVVCRLGDILPGDFVLLQDLSFRVIQTLGDRSTETISLEEPVINFDNKASLVDIYQHNETMEELSYSMQHIPVIYTDYKLYMGTLETSTLVFSEENPSATLLIVISADSEIIPDSLNSKLELPLTEGFDYSLTESSAEYCWIDKSKLICDITEKGFRNKGITVTMTAQSFPAPGNTNRITQNPASIQFDYKGVHIDPNVNNNVSNPVTLIVKPQTAHADLTTKVTIDKAEATVGDIVTVNVPVRNISSNPNRYYGTAYAVITSLKVPEGLEFLRSTDDLCTLQDGIITCPYFSLNKDSMKNKYLQFKVLNTSSYREIIVGSAEVKATTKIPVQLTIDSDLTNNISNQQKLIVRPKSDLVISAKMSKQSYMSTENISLNLKVANQANINEGVTGDAYAVLVTTAIPEGMSYLSNSNPLVSCEHDAINKSVTCNLSTIKSGLSKNLTLNFAAIPGTYSFASITANSSTSISVQKSMEANSANNTINTASFKVN